MGCVPLRNGHGGICSFLDNVVVIVLVLELDGTCMHNRSNGH